MTAAVKLVLSLRGDTYNRLRAAETLSGGRPYLPAGVAQRGCPALRIGHPSLHGGARVGEPGKMPLPAATFGLGKSLLAAGQTDEAVKELTELVGNEGDAAPAEAQFYLWTCLRQTGTTPAAEALAGMAGPAPRQPGCRLDWRLCGLARSGCALAGRPKVGAVGRHRPISPARAWQLHGCVNDVEKLMQPALVTHGGFKADDVHVLTDAQATRARFVEELQRLQRNATLSDAVVVHFSGHAVPASQPDVFGKNDENIYLLLHDTNDGPGYLTDGITADELHQLIQDIPAGRKTLILDTHPSERFMELAGREGSYASSLHLTQPKSLMSGTSMLERESVLCGMLTGALYQSLLNADDQTLSYGELDHRGDTNRRAGFIEP